jgi:hypothetical protein
MGREEAFKGSKLCLQGQLTLFPTAQSSSDTVVYSRQENINAPGSARDLSDLEAVRAEQGYVVVCVTK